VGGLYGGIKAVRSLDPSIPQKLRLSAFLSGLGKRGTRTANTLGAVALLYSGIEGLGWLLRSKQDAYNTLAATTLTPMIYWSGAGLFKCLCGGLLGAVGGMGFILARRRDILGMRSIIPDE
jgi:import inner membrane translocase subunit TIM23